MNQEWDWRRAETAKPLENQRSRWCLFQFFHSLGPQRRTGGREAAGHRAEELMAERWPRLRNRDRHRLIIFLPPIFLPIRCSRIVGPVPSDIAVPRGPRIATGRFVYRALNLPVGRITIFEKADDYAAFEVVLEETREQVAMRLLAFSVCSFLMNSSSAGGRFPRLGRETS